MPLHWKILAKNYILNIVFLTFFFISISIFFKLSRLTKYFVFGIDFSDLILLLLIFLYICFPVGVSITSFASSYITVTEVKKNGQLNAFAALGLNPSSIFTPILFIASALSLLNLAISFALSPLINSSLRSAVNNKQDQTEMLESVARKFSKKNRYISIADMPNKKQGDDFIFIQNLGTFTWLMSDKVEERNGNLKFTNSTYFKITEEESGHNSIFISENSSLILPKKSIFSIMPYATLKIEPDNISSTKIISKFLCSFYPLIFTLLGIIIALRIYTLFAAAIFAINIVLLVLSTIFLSPIFNILLACNFILTLPLYLKVQHRHKRGLQ